MMAELGSLRDWVVAVALVLGGFFLFVASLGVLRLPDVIVRMHALTKAGALGAGLVFVASAVHFRDPASVAVSLLTVIFLLATAPVAAHAIARAAYRLGVPLWEKTHLDEWQGKYAPMDKSGKAPR